MARYRLALCCARQFLVKRWVPEDLLSTSSAGLAVKPPERSLSPHNRFGDTIHSLPTFLSRPPRPPCADLLACRRASVSGPRRSLPCVPILPVLLGSRPRSPPSLPAPPQGSRPPPHSVPCSPARVSRCLSFQCPCFLLQQTSSRIASAVMGKVGFQGLSAEMPGLSESEVLKKLASYLHLSTSGRQNCTLGATEVTRSRNARLLPRKSQLGSPRWTLPPHRIRDGQPSPF